MFLTTTNAERRTAEMKGNSQSWCQLQSYVRLCQKLMYGAAYFITELFLFSLLKQ
jgi:hypothetical protein